MGRGLQLAGAKVLLTGATGGIGQAIARSLKSRGAELILTGRRADVLDQLASELDAVTFMADLSTRDDVTKLLHAAGPVDVFIAGAGHPGAGRVLELGEDDLEGIVAVNLRMPMLMAREVALSMQNRRVGQIVFMGSIGGRSRRVTPLSTTPRSSAFAGSPWACERIYTGAGLACHWWSPASFERPECSPTAVYGCRPDCVRLR